MEEVSTTAALQNPVPAFSPAVLQKIDMVCARQPHAVRKLFFQMSEENAGVVCNYIVAEKSSINIDDGTARFKISLLTYLSRYTNNKSFYKMTELDIQSYLTTLEKSEEEDPMHQWIGYYNHNVTQFRKFFKWLYQPHLPQEKRELPPFMVNIRRLKRKEKSRYKPDDLWTPDEVQIFLKYVPRNLPGIRDAAIVAMQDEDMAGARPIELLKLRIEDVKFKVASDGTKYVELPLNSKKTGQRVVPLVSSVPYLKHWLTVHPLGSNPKAWLFPTLSHERCGDRMSTHNLYDKFKRYRSYFERLLDKPEIPEEDKLRIRELVQKPWNPYLHRHTGLSRAARVLKDSAAFRKHSGHSLSSDMPTVYIHWFNTESAETLLEARGVVTENKVKIDLRPQIVNCPECNEPNKPDAKICFKCMHVLNREGYEAAKSADDGALDSKLNKIIEKKLRDLDLDSFISSLRAGGSSGSSITSSGSK